MPNNKKWRITVRLKKPIMRDFAFKPTKANAYENLGNDILEATTKSLDEFFEITIEEVEDNG